MKKVVLFLLVAVGIFLYGLRSRTRKDAGKFFQYQYL